MRPIPRSHLAQFLYGSLICSAVRWRREPDIIERGFDWTLALGDIGIYHVPLFLIIDMGVVLQHGFETRFQENQWPEEFRDVQLRYERFLSQMLQEKGILRAMEIAHFGARKSERLRRLIVLLMKSFAPHFPRIHVSNPAHLRRIMPANLSDIDAPSQAAEFLESIEDENFFYESLRTFLEDVNAHVRWSNLLQSEDFFELNHWEALSTEHLRLGCRQILEVERRLGNMDTRRIDVGEEDANAVTIFEDESSYPAGGISELTHHGDFDNLVLSELVYMETRNAHSADGTPASAAAADAAPDEIDLFDIRFIEGELLFYMRDSGQLRRKRRSVHILFDLGELFYGKSMGFEYRFAMLTQGLAISLIRELARVFEDDSVHAHFHYLMDSDDSRPTLEQEADVLSELLADEIRHGWVTIDVTKSVGINDLREPTRKTCVLAITSEPDEWNTVFAACRRESPPIFGATIGFSDDAESDLTLPTTGVSFDEIITIRNRAVAKLAGGR